MDSTTPNELSTELTAEELYLAWITDIRDRWAGNGLVLRDLAKVWSMGVAHAQRADSYGDSRSFINPFW